MNSYELMKKWRNAIKEQQQIQVPLNPDLEPENQYYSKLIDKIVDKNKTPNYDKLVSQAKDRIEYQDKEYKLDDKCEINNPCACVDRRETDLDINEIQKILNQYFSNEKIDMSIKVTGDCNPETQNAIIRFQNDQKLELCDGCVGDETHGKMLELGLTDMPVKILNYNQGTSPSPDEVTAVVPASLTAATGFSSGETIAVMAKKSGQPYGKGKQNPGALINSVNFREKLQGNQHFIVQPGASYRRNRQYGHPVLLEALIAAAKSVSEAFPDQRGKGLASLGNVSLKNGGPLSPHWSHQAGLDADVTYYRNDGKSDWFAAFNWNYSRAQLRKLNKNRDPGSKKVLRRALLKKGGGLTNTAFDMPRNVHFLAELVKMPQIKEVFLDNPIIKAMIGWIEVSDKEGVYDQLLNNLKQRRGKVYQTGDGGHQDHYHVRADFGQVKSISWKEYKRIKNSAPKASSETPGAHYDHIKAKYWYLRIPIIFNDLDKKSLKEIIKMYPNKIAFAMGKVSDNEPNSSNSYQQNKLIYGASSPKTMNALAHMVTHPKNTAGSMKDEEIKGTLTYTSRRARKAKTSAQRRHLSKFSSNAINRALSEKHRYRKNKSQYIPYRYRSFRGSLGPLKRLRSKQVREVSKIFGIKNSVFLWGGNKQSPRDMFKFFSGLQRMTTGQSEGKEKEWYDSLPLWNSIEKTNAVDEVVKVQKTRAHSPRVNYSTITKMDHWGKGGRDAGAVSHTFVVNGTHVISVYVAQIHNPKKDKVRQDSEVYAILNAVLKKLVERI